MLKLAQMKVLKFKSIQYKGCSKFQNLHLRYRANLEIQSSMINHPLNQKDFLKKVFDIKIQSASTHEKKKLCHRYIHRPRLPRGFLVKDLFALASKKNSQCCTGSLSWQVKYTHSIQHQTIRISSTQALKHIACTASKPPKSVINS